MVNTNIEGPIPFAGSGFVAKPAGNYKPGEFRQLANAEINNDGVLVNRRSIQATGNGGSAISNPFPFVGYVEDYAIVASTTTQTAVGKNANTALWAPTSLPVPAGGYHRIIGAFKYNKTYYWLTLEYNPTGPVYNICLYSTTTNFLTATFANLTRTVIITQNTSPTINAYYIFKDRLFISTDSTVYFSKATDPLTWASPYGGFFKLPDRTITHTFGNNDTIFVLTDSSVHAFSYSVDPNSDGYMRPISTSVGGEHGCVHRSQPYFINKTGIYAISNMDVSKVNECRYDVGENIFTHKIISFEDYLVVSRCQRVNYDGLGASDPKYRYNMGRVFSPGQYGNTFNWNLFFWNTSNNSTHVVDFTDSNDTAAKGYVIDVIVNPNKDTSGDYELFLLTNKSLGGGSYQGSAYFMRPQKDVTIYDACRDSNNSVVRYKPRILVEIDSYTPDGNEYLVKRFRNLLVMAKFPQTDFGVEVAFDDTNYTRPKITLTNDLGQRGHFPARVAVNQRARSMSIKFSSSNNYTSLGVGGYYDRLEISDLRVLWAHTLRSTKYQTRMSTNATP